MAYSTAALCLLVVACLCAGAHAKTVCTSTVCKSSAGTRAAQQAAPEQTETAYYGEHYERQHPVYVNPGKGPGACHRVVAASLVPFDCAAIQDPFITASNPNLCASVSCPSGGVLAGFSCQVVSGVPAGFYIANAAGAFPLTGNPTQMICAAVDSTPPTALLFAAGTCCIDN